MSDGISPNNLNDLSKVYLDQVAAFREIRKQETEKDIERWSHGADPTATQNEEVKGQDTERRKAASADRRSGERISKKEAPSETKKFVKNAERSIKWHDKVSKGRFVPGEQGDTRKEGFSYWRNELREVIDQDVAGFLDRPETDKEAEKKVSEKKVKNKIKINPTLSDAVKMMGGELLEVTETEPNSTVVDHGNDPTMTAINAKEKRQGMLKKQVLLKKLQAVRAGAGQDITASYEPEIESAVEYFYEEGINEEGLDLIIEEIGLEEFVDFIDESSVELNEERKARKMNVRSRKTLLTKTIPAQKEAEAKRQEKKTGEYKETPKKTPRVGKPGYTTTVKAAPKKPVAPKKPEAPKTPAPPKPAAKKVVKAVAKAKVAQPAKKPSKETLRDKINTAYKAGVKRHKKAVQPARVFAKGMKAGAKATVKFAGKAKKALVGEKLDYDPMKDPDFDPIEAEKNRGVSGKNNPKKGKKLKDLVKVGEAYKAVTNAPDSLAKMNKRYKPVKKIKNPTDRPFRDRLKDPDYKVDMDEAKVDTGSAEAKASARNKRNTPAGKDSKFDTSVFITRKPGESLDSARTRTRQKAHAAKRGVKEDKAFDNVVGALRKKHGESGVLTKDSPKPKAKPLDAKQIWRRDDRNAVQREVDAQYGRTPWNKKGSLGT